MNPRTVLWLLSGIVSSVVAFFAAGTTHHFPMDDAYIHAVYAQSLAWRHELTFNPGEFSGIGATSILWVLLLTAGCKLGIEPVVFAKILGVLCFLVSMQCVYKLTQTLFRRVLGMEAVHAPLVATVLYALSGNMLWFSLSGMETPLFLTLGLVALVLYQQGRLVGMSLSLALMTLTRTEGVLLGAILVTLYWLRTQRVGDGSTFANIRPWAYRRFPHHAPRWFPTASVLKASAQRRLDRNAGAARIRIALSTVLFLSCIIPWFLFLFASTGHALPTSFAGKKLSQMAAMNYFLLRGPCGPLLVHLKPLVFLVTWLFYVVLFVFGGVWMPGPSIPLSQVSNDLRLSLVALAIFAIAVTPLLVLGARRLLAALPACVKESPHVQAVGALFIWFAMHNLAYMVMFPSMGTTTRYQAINHLILWVTLTAGLFALDERKTARARVGFRVGMMVLTFFSLAGVLYWRDVYRANLDHMVKARIAAAEYINRHLPPDAVIAAHDIGAIRYYSHRRVVDLGGLVDAQFTQYQKGRALDVYLRNQRVGYLVIPGKHSSEDAPLYDFLAFLGLDRSLLYRLREIASFENDRAVWAFGNGPTANYLPSVKVYAIDWRT